jgi:hypothetical protein
MKGDESVHGRIGDGGMGTVAVQAQPSGAEVSSASQGERSAGEVLAARQALTGQASPGRPVRAPGA